MADPVLYSFRRCPYAMRARMALRISGVPYEHREVVLRNKPAAMLQISPKGTVPVLSTQDAGVLEESLDIMAWALKQNDPEGWLARSDAALVSANDGPFKHHLDRYKYATRYEDADPQEHGQAALTHLAVLEQRLTDKPYLCGAARGHADIAIFPFVRQFANADADWFAAQDLPRVQTWLETLVTSDLFAGIMEKHEPWAAP